ncbi:MAG TPA: MgtC/SapB family protein [Gemmatimonadaceae bacterium]|nr:MgtC/SapB family protein [Gemmatimonadaceae bacterium]
MSDALKFVLLFKLLLATFLGGAIGFEREIAGKPAGLRTNILICVGAALFTHLSISIAQIGFTPDGRPYGDTTRITAQIVSGIGFLGAGAILHAHGAVVGLTTAATIWVVAAVGAAVGAGAYVEGVGTSVLIILVLVGLRPVERRLLNRRRKVNATIRVQREVRFDVIEDIIRICGLHLVSRRTYEHDSDRAFELELIGTAKQIDLAIDDMRRRQDIVSVSVE